MNTSRFRRFFGLILVSALIAPALTACRSSQKITTLRQAATSSAKRDALAKLEKIYSSARMHQVMIEHDAITAAGADNNLDAVVYAGELMSKLGYHTLTLASVADSAARAKRELPQFKELLELSIRKLSGSQQVTDLADWASKLERDEDLPTLTKRIAELASSAECSSVEDAIAKEKAMLKKLGIAN
jgi:hypothetical protein